MAATRTRASKIEARFEKACIDRGLESLHALADIAFKHAMIEGDTETGYRLLQFYNYIDRAIIDTGQQGSSSVE